MRSMLYFVKSCIFFLFSLLFVALRANDAEIKQKYPDKNPIIDSDTKSLDLLSNACLNFFNTSKDDASQNIGNSLRNSGLTMGQIIATLKFINLVQQEDREFMQFGKRQIDGSLWSYRMSKYWFILQNFDFYRVSGNLQSARLNKVNLPYGKTKITKYAIFELEMSLLATNKNDMEIYGLPEWVNPKTGLQQYRLRFTKQEIFDGVYRVGGLAAGKAKPLGYTSRNNLELALLQGTFVGHFADGSKKIYAIAGSNEYPFDNTEKQFQQKRYIYFKESDDFYGYGKVKEEKIKIQPGLTFAGDINQFGLGKLMLMCYEDTVTKTMKAKIGILADTGSAFVENSFHFDFLSGVYESKKTFYKEADKIPHFCEMYILIKK